MKATTKNPYADANKEARKIAAQNAQNAALVKRAAELASMPQHIRVHAHLLSPYVTYAFQWQAQNADGSYETQTGSQQAMFPLNEFKVAEDGKDKTVDGLLNHLQYTDLVRDLSGVLSRLELLYTARTTSSGSTVEDAIKSDAKKELQRVYSRLEYTSDKPEECTKYIANIAAIETLYIFAFKISGEKFGRMVEVRGGEKMLNTLIFVLWSKLVSKGYTLGCVTKMPEEFRKMAEEEAKKKEKLEKAIPAKKK